MSALPARIVATALLIVVTVLTSAAGCASKPPPPPKPLKTTITVSADASVNPDASGRSLPVVVRFYRLNSDVSFMGSEFFALFDDDKKVLAADLIARDEYELLPGESQTLELVLPPEVRFVGAIAAFRDIRNATWRAVVAAPPQPPPPPKKSKVKPKMPTIHVIAARQTLRIELEP
jgi:type VI secretion system protein VasD